MERDERQLYRFGVEEKGIGEGDNMNAKLNICVIASTYPRYPDDTAVPWLRESVRRLVNRGHTVSIIAPSFKGLKDHYIDGVKVNRFR